MDDLKRPKLVSHSNDLMSGLSSFAQSPQDITFQQIDFAINDAYNKNSIRMPTALKEIRNSLKQSQMSSMIEDSPLESETKIDMHLPS